MTLKQLAEQYSKDYEFRVVDKNDKGLGKFERNELVKLDYKVAELEVVEHKTSQLYFDVIYVMVDYERGDS